MKQLFIGLTLLALVIGKNSYASETKIPATVKESFESIFGSSTDVTWTVTNGLYKAIFTIGDKKVIQYYNQDGDLVAIARYINGEDLGSELFAQLKLNAQNYSIKEIFEVSNEDGATYYATIENDSHSIVFKSSGKTWKPFTKIKK